MKKEKLLIIGYRAYGDWLYFSAVLPYLFDKYEVHIELNRKGYELFHDDPRFAGITLFEFEHFPKEDMEKRVFARWKAVEEEIKPDKVINLWRSLETECIAEAYMPEFNLSTKERQALYGHKGFYKAVFDKCEIPMPEVFREDRLFFTDSQLVWAEKWREEHQNDFVIMMNIAGSCSHKVYPEMPRLIFDVLDKYPNAYIYMTGDASVAHAQLDHPRIRKTCGDTPIKQIVLMAKHADYVFGGETGVLVAAGMWGTPKTMLCTASGLKQTCGDDDNDYSIQAEIKCSPCHKAVYCISDCENMVVDGEDTYPICIMSFPYEKIMSTVEEVYNRKNIYNHDYYAKYVEKAESEIGKVLYDERWRLVEKYCHGNMTLLDYGCASGAFHKSSRNGFDCHGFDVNPYSGFNTLPEKPIEILTMWDVVEHLKHPDETLKGLDADWIFISTPNVDAAEDFESWKHNRPGEHLHYFNRESLGELLSEIGYEVKEFNYGEGEIRDPETPKNIISVVAKRVG